MSRLAYVSAVSIAFTLMACGDVVTDPHQDATADPPEESTPEERGPEPIVIPLLIVSDPVARPPSDASTGSESLSSTSTTYVSLPPGSMPGMVSVRIRNATVGGAATPPVPMIDGGFDPVAVAATENDELALEFTDVSGEITLAKVLVPPKRPPVVVRSSPPPGRTDVSLNVHPMVVFSEPIDPGTISRASIRLLAGGTPVDGEALLHGELPWVAEFVPAAPLEPGTTYQLEVTEAIRDVEGDALAGSFTATFVTETVPVGVAGTYDRVSPSAIPGSSRYIIRDDGSFILRYDRPDGGSFEYTGAYSGGSSLIRFDFDGWSAAGPWLATGVMKGDSLFVEYNLVMALSDFEDGVFVRSHDAGSPPAVVESTPLPGSTDVPLSVRPRVVFSEPVDPGTVSPESIRLLQGGLPIDGEAALLPEQPRVAEFVPAAPLEPLTTYELVVTQDVRDLQGEALQAPFAMTFATLAMAAGVAGTYDRVSPSVIPGSSHYIIREDGSFSLRYDRPDWGSFEYAGRYSVDDALITFDFDGWSAAGPWLATGVMKGDSLVVEYNIVMFLTDFEDGVFVRSDDTGSDDPGAPASGWTSLSPMP